MSDKLKVYSDADVPANLQTGPVPIILTARGLSPINRPS